MSRHHHRPCNLIGGQPDGRRINQGCGSTHLEPLRRAVLERGAAMGFAFDGDADVLAADADFDDAHGDAGPPKELARGDDERLEVGRAERSLARDGGLAILGRAGPASADSAAGRYTRNVVPCPGRLSTLTPP